jgi:competence protein ComEC
VTAGPGSRPEAAVAHGRAPVGAGARLCLATARHHPRHVVLFAAVAGLLAGPLLPQAVVPLAVAAALLAWRPVAALAAACAVLAGALVADARGEALGPGALSAAIGADISADVVLVEPVRTRANGSAVARVRIVRAAPAADSPVEVGSHSAGSLSADASAGLGTRLAGALAVARSLDGRVPAGADVGRVLRVRARVAELGRSDAYQRRRGAHAALVLHDWSLTGARRGGLAGGLDAARDRASYALGRGLAAPEAALVRGMVLGQDEQIPADTRTAFERSGLAHLLAVSGQNVLLLCTLVLALGAIGGLPLRTRLLLAMAVVALYVPLTGAGPSIQRAGIMGVAGLVAALAGRPASRWYALGLAAAVTLGLNPAAAGEPGWQLSFAAVAGLLALAPPIRDGLQRRRVPRAVAEILAVTVAATLSTGPLLAFHFEQVSVVSLPANLAAAPAVPLLMWLGMLAMAVGQVAPALAEPLNQLNAPLLAYVDWVAATAAAPQSAMVPVRLGGPGAVAVTYGLGAALLVGLVRAWRAARPLTASRVRAGPGTGLGGRRLATAGGVAAALAAACLALAGGLPASSGVAPPRPGELVVSFLEVGQGDATLLQLDGSAVLVDTGPPGGPILRRLDEAGVGRLDALVLTHAQTDHEGMALPVLRRHRPRLVLNGGDGWDSTVQSGLPAAVGAVGSRVLAAHAGQVLSLGKLRFRVLWPPSPPPGWRPEGDANLTAMVAHVSVGDFDLLLPADAESEVTGRLRLPPMEALKVAHHGSEDAALPRLLDRLRPQFAAIEVGRDNTYGHPAPSTLSALRGVPQLVRTDRDGTVRLRVARGQMQIERERG